MTPPLCYLDHAATSPPPAEITESLARHLKALPWNASAIYEQGLLAREALDRARKDFAEAMRAGSGSVIFTSGGTESNNLAVRAAASGRPAASNMPAVAWISPTVHPSLAEPVRALSASGWTVVEMPVLPGGHCDTDSLGKLPAPRMAAFEWVNSEIGFVQPVEEISAVLRRLHPDCLFLVDGAQGFGKLPAFDLSLIDAFSISGHKLGAPVGVGALFLGPRMPRTPLLLGGGQEDGMRSGTVSVPLVLSFRDALRRAAGKRPPDFGKIVGMGGGKAPSPIRRREAGYSPYIWVLDTSPVDGEVLLHHLEKDGVIVGLGSACRAGKRGISAAHRAIGMSEEASRRTLRLSFAPGEDEDSLRRAWDIICRRWYELSVFFGAR